MLAKRVEVSDFQTAAAARVRPSLVSKELITSDDIMMQTESGRAREAGAGDGLAHHNHHNNNLHQSSSNRSTGITDNITVLLLISVYSICLPSCFLALAYPSLYAKRFFSFNEMYGCTVNSTGRLT